MAISIVLSALPDTLTTFLPYMVVVNASLLQPISAQELQDTTFLWDLIPPIYKTPNRRPDYGQTAVNRFEGLVKSLDGMILMFRHLLSQMVYWLDPYQIPYQYLQYLAPIVGVEFNFDIPESYARREIANAIYLWKRKGSRENVKDWIRFLTGFEVQIREYYREVLHFNVWGQAYADTPIYATLPHRNDHHALNVWSGSGNVGAWYNPIPDDANYGFHGYYDLREEVPGYLFRNHIGLYIDIPDENLELTWFGSPFYNVFVTKITRILDLILLYGTVPHLFYRLITIEDPPYCGQDEVEEDHVPCNVEEMSKDSYGDTYCLDIDSPCDGRIVNVILCFNDPEKGFNTDHIFYVPQTRYWIEYTIDDELQTWIPDLDGILDNTAMLPLEESYLESLVNPQVGDGDGQGLMYFCDISPWVLENISTTSFETILIDDNWNSPYEPVTVIDEDWEVDITFTPVTIIDEDWEEEIPALISDLELWLDGDYGVLAASPVVSWLDKSGHGRHAIQGTPSSRPENILEDATLNDTSVVQFNGITQYLRVPHDAALNAAAFTVFFVGYWQNNAGDVLLAKYTDDTYMQGWSLRLGPDQSLEFCINDATLHTLSVPDLNDNIPTIICAQYDGMQLTLFINGGVRFMLDYGAGLMPSTGDLLLAAGPDTLGTGAANFGETTIGTVTYHSRLLTDDEINAMLFYLAEKYFIMLDPPAVLLLSETWEPPTYIANEEVSEEWNFDLVALLQETWEPPSYTPMSEVNEDWESSQTLLLAETWEPPTYTEDEEVSEEWDYAQASLINETWEAPTYAATLEVTENFEPDMIPKVVSDTLTLSITDTASLITMVPLAVSDTLTVSITDAATVMDLAIFTGSPTAAFGVNRVIGSYSGPLMKVRRSSDNTTLDINALSNGTLDTTALLAFTGTGGSDNGFIDTWYDQTGNGRHLVQSTQANQPKIVNAGAVITSAALNNMPVIDFDGSNDYLLNATDISNFITNSAGTVFVAFVPEAAPGTTGQYVGPALWSDDASYLASSLYTTASQPKLDSYNWETTVAIATRDISLNAGHIHVWKHGGAQIINYLDSATEATASSGNTAVVTGDLRVGRNYNGTTHYDGKMFFLVFYNTALSESTISSQASLFATTLGLTWGA